MIIDSLEIKNFGVYKSNHRFEFTPGFASDKTITLVRGKNGAGKTTLMEAIQLALMGTFSLDSRVSETSFEKYLISRIHNKSGEKYPENGKASVELKLKYLITGDPSVYRISRNWGYNFDNFISQPQIFENDFPLGDLTDKEKDLVIRQLIPPGLANLMFFDGEYLQSLHIENRLNEFLSESCKSVFGLHLVNSAQNDLGIYTHRLKERPGFPASIEELENAAKKVEEAKKKEAEYTKKMERLLLEIEETKIEIKKQEQKISTEGRLHSEMIVSKRERVKILEEKIFSLKSELEELYNGLAPFAIAKNLCVLVEDRLIKEGESEKGENAREVIENRFKRLKDSLKDGEIFKKLNLDVSEEQSDYLVRYFKAEILPQKKSEDLKIIHNYTEADRNKLIKWIDKALNSIPYELLKKTKELNLTQNELSQIQGELSKVPDSDVIAPMLKSLEQLNQHLGKLTKEIEDCEKEIEKIKGQIVYSENNLSAIQKRLIENENMDTRFSLANRLQLVFKDYYKQLLQTKLKLLGKHLVQKFNLLCRKRNYFDEAIIDPETFNVNLLKKKQIVKQEFLSAGERQLLALSALWALREMTKIKLPLIIDTPLGRLDNSHRGSMIDIFLPSVSHQVIVLGTEAELDDTFLHKLENHIVRIYELDFDEKNQSTIVTNNTSSFLPKIGLPV